MPVTARPASKAEAVRIIVARNPEITDDQLLKQLVSEFGPKMRMQEKMAYNYRRTALDKLGLSHPSRPARNGPAPTPEPSEQPAEVDQLDELIRIGKAMGWSRVKAVAEIAEKLQE